MLRILLLVALAPACFSPRWTLAAPPAELLWPQGAAGALGEAEKDKPTFAAWLPPEKAAGTAVVICAGGGYGTVVLENAEPLARWLNDLGVAAFILKYRHAGHGYRHPAPLQDAQRALRTVRSRAPELQISPTRIGILGISAGGHLASLASTHFAPGRGDSPDKIEQISYRPDFAILLWPVISLTTRYTHVLSKENLLGSSTDGELDCWLSTELQVTPETPPTFLIHSGEDTAVPPENSVLFYLALRKANVPAEMHVFERGEHGALFATRARRTWLPLCTAWLEAHGLMKQDQRLPGQ